MDQPTSPTPRPTRGPWLMFAFFFAIALLMYVSIMIKIIKFGP